MFPDLINPAGVNVNQEQRDLFMYGLPGSLIQFGTKRARSKPGRKSVKAAFLEKQSDLFPVDLYTSKLTNAHQAARSGGEKRAGARSEASTAARSAALPPATNRGGKFKECGTKEAAEKLPKKTKSISYAGKI